MRWSFNDAFVVVLGLDSSGLHSHWLNVQEWNLNIWVNTSINQPSVLITLPKMISRKMLINHILKCLRFATHLSQHEIAWGRTWHAMKIRYHVKCVGNSSGLPTWPTTWKNTVKDLITTVEYATKVQVKHALKITNFIKALLINTAELVLTKYPANDPHFHCYWHHP